MAGVKMRVRITGAGELTRRLNVLGEKAKEVVEPAAMAGAEVIRKAASEKAPRDTGFLAEHIVAEVKDVQPLKATIQVGPDKDAYYGLFVELGHALVRGSTKATRKVIGNVPPHPFLRPALDENKQEAKAAVAEEIRRRLGL